MRTFSHFITLSGLSFLLAACQTTPDVTKPPPLSAMQREAMQTKEVPGDFETVFAATLSVLQDEGWQIDAVERESGVIQASSLKRQALWGPESDWLYEQTSYRTSMISVPWTRWERLTARVEPWKEGTVRVRITIVKCGSCGGSITYM